MAEELQNLKARAKWCRRLARDCFDEQLRSSLQQIAADLERRAHPGQP
jgi:hypothetical protein